MHTPPVIDSSQDLSDSRNLHIVPAVPRPVALNASASPRNSARVKSGGKPSNSTHSAGNGSSNSSNGTNAGEDNEGSDDEDDGDDDASGNSSDEYFSDGDDDVMDVDADGLTEEALLQRLMGSSTGAPQTWHGCACCKGISTCVCSLCTLCRLRATTTDDASYHHSTADGSSSTSAQNVHLLVSHRLGRCSPLL